MFHQKSRGVSLILFSDGVPEMESVEKPNYARYGHGAASILDYTIMIDFFIFSRSIFTKLWIWPFHKYSSFIKPLAQTIRHLK